MPMKCSGFDSSSSALNYTKKRMWIVMVNGFMYIYIMHFKGNVKISSHLTTQDRLLTPISGLYPFLTPKCTLSYPFFFVDQAYI